MPGGTPHAVENVSDCLAIAGNFVDDSNLDAVLGEMSTLGERDHAVTEAADALYEMDFDVDDGMIDHLLPLDELVVPAQSDDWF